MQATIEKTYGKTVRGIMFAVNPIKKIIIKTYCLVHRHINAKALGIIKYSIYKDEYCFYSKYMKYLNEGSIWADQDFKSSNHFYHYKTGSGLYGFSNALAECKKYHGKAIAYIQAGDIRKGMFFFGAACHLLQDSTVPQHVNNKLLKSHRNFELWILERITLGKDFEGGEVIERHESIEEYIKCNAIVANNVYLKYFNILDKECKYEKIANEILKKAEVTTAGFMLDFYEDIKAYIE